MAVGQSAEPVWKLQDDLVVAYGPTKADEILINELVRWMSGQDIEEFVENFRTAYEMKEKQNEDCS